MEPWLTGVSEQIRARVDRIRVRGFERADDSLQPGITDIVFPIFGRAAAEKISGALGQ